MPVGRPTKYEGEKTCKLATTLCSLGADDKKLAEGLQIEESTLFEWKNTYEEFSSSIKKAKAKYDDDSVEVALLKSALGFKRMIEKPGKDGVVACYEEMPPNPTSLIFWLKNRRREYWKDKQELEHSGNVHVTPTINLKNHFPDDTK